MIIPLFRSTKYENILEVGSSNEKGGVT